MGISLTKIAKTINLDLSDVPQELRSEVKKEVGEYVVDEILKSVSSGKSPVSGGGAFKALNENYADNEKGGNRTPNLELDGDMLDSLTFKNTTGGVEVGIFKSSEVPKADGHNNFSGKSKLPTRRFIPDESQLFEKSIERGIKDIVSEYKSETPTSTTFEPIFSETKETTSITIGDLFSDDFLGQFLRDEGFI